LECSKITGKHDWMTYVQALLLYGSSKVFASGVIGLKVTS